MKKGAVIIGVDKTGDLPILNAAGSGAIDFSNWANKQGFDVTLLIDTNDRAVTVADISNAINQYVQAQTYSQLIVYFSGHGVLRGPDYELWLLSGSPANPNEAVNLSGSILMARNARIKHVVFISDACRSRRALTIVDNYSHQCLAIHVGQSLKGEDVVAMMNHLKIVHLIIPSRIQVDNGSEFIRSGGPVKSTGFMGVR